MRKEYGCSALHGMMTAKEKEKNGKLCTLLLKYKVLWYLYTISEMAASYHPCFCWKLLFKSVKYLDSLTRSVHVWVQGFIPTKQNTHLGLLKVKSDHGIRCGFCLPGIQTCTQDTPGLKCFHFRLKPAYKRLFLSPLCKNLWLQLQDISICFV